MRSDRRSLWHWRAQNVVHFALAILLCLPHHPIAFGNTRTSSWSGSDVYEFLAAPSPRYAGATEVFNDPGASRDLEDVIQSVPELKKLADKGLEYRRNYLALFESDFSAATRRLIAQPWNEAISSLGRFQPTLVRYKDQPLPRWQIEMMAMSDAAARFGLPPAMTVAQLASRRHQDLRLQSAY